MKVAITGGTGFVGRNIARALAAEGHDLVIIARGRDKTDPTIRALERTHFVRANLDDAEALAEAMSGCEAIVHCAGINRELGRETYEKVHVEGTRHVVEAARRVEVRKVVLISFLRARANCGSGYHESKWAAEEIVRQSGLDYTVLKSGVIYGRGDHMLNHLSRAFYTFPVFAFVGFCDKPIRPNAVEDVARIVKACIVDGALSRKTVAVMGPEELTLRAAVRRVAEVVQQPITSPSPTLGERVGVRGLQFRRAPLMFPMPVWMHYVLGWCLERIMKVPLVSVAQVRMLSEGLAEAVPPCDAMPDSLAPRIRFTKEQIRKGLPAPGPFTWRDLRCCRDQELKHSKRVFFEMP